MPLCAMNSPLYPSLKTISSFLALLRRAATLPPPAMLKDINELSEQDLLDIGAKRTDIGKMIDGDKAKLRGRALGRFD